MKLQLAGGSQSQRQQAPAFDFRSRDKGFKNTDKLLFDKLPMKAMMNIMTTLIFYKQLEIVF